MARRYAPPKALPSEPGALAVELKRQLDVVAQVLAELDPEPGELEALTDTVVAVSPGSTTRLSPPSEGQTVVFPGAAPDNRGKTITLLVVNPSGTLTLRPLDDTVNGATALTTTAYGSIVLKSDGIGDWLTSSAPLPTAEGSDANSAPVDATYLVQNAHAELPNARRAVSSPEIVPTFGVASVVSWVIATASIALSKLADLAGLSVLGRAANSSGVMAAITATTADTLLRVNAAGTALEWGQATTDSYADASVTAVKLASDVTLAEVLSRGDETLANDIHVSTGQQLIFDVGGDGLGDIQSLGAFGLRTAGAISMIAATGNAGMVASAGNCNFSGTAQLNFTATTGFVRFQTAGVNRFRFNNDGSFGVGSGNDVGTAGELFISQGSTTPIWGQAVTASYTDGSVTLPKIEDIADDTFLVNISGGAAPPTAVALSTLGQSRISYNATTHGLDWDGFDLEENGGSPSVGWLGIDAIDSSTITWSLSAPGGGLLGLSLDWVGLPLLEDGVSAGTATSLDFTDTATVAADVSGAPLGVVQMSVVAGSIGTTQLADGGVTPAKLSPGPIGSTLVSFGSFADPMWCHVLTEQFFGGGATTTISGQWGWGVSNVTEQDTLGPEPGHSGIRRYLRAGGGHGYVYAANVAADLGEIDIADVAFLYFVVRIPNTGTQTVLTSRRFMIGLAQDASDTAGNTPDLGGNGIVFRKSSTSSTWTIRSENASTVTNTTTETVVLDDWAECLMINEGSGNWGILVNGVDQGTHASVPTSGVMTPVIAVDADAVDVYFDVDEFTIGFLASANRYG